MAVTNSITPTLYCTMVKFVLQHKWEGVDFRVETVRNPMDLFYILRIGVPTKDSGLVYITQKAGEEEFHRPPNPPKISDETIATIMLLLG